MAADAHSVHPHGAGAASGALKVAQVPNVIDQCIDLHEHRRQLIALAAQLELIEPMGGVKAFHERRVGAAGRSSCLERFQTAKDCLHLRAACATRNAARSANLGTAGAAGLGGFGPPAADDEDGGGASDPSSSTWWPSAPGPLLPIGN